MSESCANCGIDVDKEPFVLCDECDHISAPERVAALESVLAASQARERRLREWMRLHADHTDKCGLINSGGILTCTCGFSAALAEEGP